jgi:hypothetical protein
MACVQIQGGGDGLQIWRLAENILNMQSRIADKRLPSRLGDGQGATPHRKKAVSKCHIGLPLLSKNIKINSHKTKLLPVLLYECETWSLTLCLRTGC